jgi:hypothetical protein
MISPAGRHRTAAAGHLSTHKKKNPPMKTTTANWKWLGLAVVTGAGLALVHAAGPDQRRIANQAFMRQKLVLSQGILEGLTLEKFSLVTGNALRLRNLSVSNVWTEVGSPDYRRNLTNFQASIDGLYTAAIDQNLDRATEAYAKVTRSCVECHRQVRLDQHLRTLAPAK